MQTMVQYNDGFKISEIDLKLRGPGDILGTAQSGFPELKHINIIRDSEIIMNAKKTAFAIIKDDPHFRNSSNLILKKNLLKYYSASLKFAKIA
jgi:ATP-dependent DNA helicase RecG